MFSSKFHAEDIELIMHIKLWTEEDYEYKIKKTAFGGLLISKPIFFKKKSSML